MVALLASGFGLLFAGVWWGQLAFSSVGLGILVVAVSSVFEDEHTAALWRLLRLRVELTGLRRSHARVETVMNATLPWCRMFAERYPVYWRLPYDLRDDGLLKLSVTPLAWLIPFREDAAPESLRDLAEVLAQQGVEIPGVRWLALWVNREVFRTARRRVLSEALGGNAPLSLDAARDAFERYVHWEKRRTENQGEPSLLYREALGDILQTHLDVRELKRSVGLSSRASIVAWLLTGIADAERDILCERRAEELRRRLTVADDRPPPFVQALSVERLRELAIVSLEAATRAACGVFASEGGSEANQGEWSEGRFVSAASGSIVLFQLGWDAGPETTVAVVERTYVRKARIGASHAVVLALSRTPEAVLRAADELGILVLAADALDRLLSYHSERMWQTVDWSLRTSLRARTPSDTQRDGENREKENEDLGLELGLST